MVKEKYDGFISKDLGIVIDVASVNKIKEGIIKDDSLICLAAFGSGFTWASALLRW